MFPLVNPQNSLGKARHKPMARTPARWGIPQGVIVGVTSYDLGHLCFGLEKSNLPSSQTPQVW